MALAARTLRIPVTLIAILVWAECSSSAHSGPPFPIVPARVIGPYQVEVWTDPDATDDGTARGQFWVMMHRARSPEPLPGDTRAEVSILPRDRSGHPERADTSPVNGDVTRQFCALVMDHEGPFGVTVAINGPLGRGEVSADVDATYDLRPRPILMALYLLPFLLVGFLWLKLIIRRRGAPERTRTRIQAKLRG